jgi:rhamnulose-1-phosphate aldolase
MKVLDAEFVRGFIRLTEDAWLKGWHERNGGNLSYRIKPEEVKLIENELNPRAWQPVGVEGIANLAGEFFLVTGSGKYFRNITLAPADNIVIIEIDSKGKNYRICWGLENGGRPTSELPTHLINHSIKKEITKNKHRVILHTHTPNIIALTFVLPLEDKIFTRYLWQMITECPIVFSSGIGVLEWMVPCGNAIANASRELMKKYDIVVWAHHGTFCSGENFDSTFGLMDTVEKAAEILVKVLSMGGIRQSITTDNILELAKTFHLTLPEEFLIKE